MNKIPRVNIGEMEFAKYRSKRMLLLIGVLTLLLVTLATLQYRWVGQVSTGERERMQASLNAGANRFSQDFNREITRAYLSFQLDAAMLQEEKTSGLAKRFDQWDAQAPYPRLISDLYLVDNSEMDHSRLTHFDRAQNRLEFMEWPSEFAVLRQQLEHGFVKSIGEHELLKELSVNPVEPNVPALVLPLITAPRVLVGDGSSLQVERKGNGDVAAQKSPFMGYLIIKLNKEVITNELIPALARRYFSGGNGLEYNLSVINSQEPDKLVYQSGPAQSKQQQTNGDATARLMDIQPDQLDALWFGLPRKNIDTESRGLDSQPVIPHGNVEVRTDTETKSGTKSSRSVTVRVINRETPGITPFDKNANSGGPWQLLIQHRAGSLEAAVTSARRRNLAISFGILLLLAGSMAMIVVWTRRAERLANRQIEFVSAVSHEFRTPLSVICSAGENLADGIIDGSDQTKRYGELIRNEGRRLSEMVEQVLEFAGARGRHPAYQLRPVHIESIIKDALAPYQPLIQERGYVVEKEVEANLPMVVADSAALRRSLQNLLSNAMKYESTNRWIGISAKSAVYRNGDEVQLIIEDKGIGIAADEVPHIFEPFYRGREVVDAQIHGNGLGLSLVKQVMDAHHGRVSVVSKTGQGSAFTLHLPVIGKSHEKNGDHDTASI
jgi:signal transduction histidine kinase